MNNSARLWVLFLCVGILSAFSLHRKQIAQEKNCIRICVTLESSDVRQRNASFSALPICYNFHKCVSVIYLCPRSVVTRTIVILINGNVVDPVFSVGINVAPMGVLITVLCCDGNFNGWQLDNILFRWNGDLLES